MPFLSFRLRFLEKPCTSDPLDGLLFLPVKRGANAAPAPALVRLRIIRPITQCLSANKLDSVYGILNGTTNYILTEMIENGASFDDALHQAQANGFAEADPTADIEGLDAARKICILADLCFGKHVEPADIKAQGISGVSSAERSRPTPRFS